MFIASVVLLVIAISSSETFSSAATLDLRIESLSRKSPRLPLLALTALSSSIVSKAIVSETQLGKGPAPALLK